MDFRKKLKTRLNMAIAIIAIGLVFIVINIFSRVENTFLSSFGFALMVCGVARIKRHFLITKNEETIRKQEIAESDERNIAIANKAKSVAFILYIFAVCIAMITLATIGIYSELVTLMGGSVCLLVVIYWVCYFIIKKRS